MKKILSVVLLMAMVALTACGGKGGTDLSSFTAQDVDGNEVDQSVFKGHKVTMINMWGTFCGPCLEEMPDIAELAKEYDLADVQVIGIVVDVPQNEDGTYDEAQLTKAKELIEQTGADYMHLLPSADLEELKLKSVNAIPETMFVDEEGKQLGKSYMGSRTKDEWKKILDDLL